MTESEFLKLTENYNHLIFDFGGIFININYQNAIDEMNRICQSHKASDLYSQHSQVNIFSDLETGKINEEIFLKELNLLLGLNQKEAELKVAWNSMLYTIPSERIDFLKKLRKTKKIYLLSNINEIHEKHIHTLANAADFYAEFDKIYFSHHLGLRKPDPEIFKYVLKDIGISVEKAFFMDDSIGHIEAARALKIESLHLEKQNSFITH